MHAVDPRLWTVRDPSALQGAVETALRSVSRGAFPGFEWLTALLDLLGSEAIVAFPEELALFRKVLLTLAAVARDVSETASIDSALSAGAAVKFFEELPRRTLALPVSRQFATHLSNVDLLGI